MAQRLAEGERDADDPVHQSELKIWQGLWVSELPTQQVASWAISDRESLAGADS
jgi:hypothetical protein